MIYRFKSKEVLAGLQHFPAVAILGPRQVGKTTLAKSLVLEGRDIVWLDLEKESDRFKLQNAHDYLRGLEDSCVVLDEVQEKPELFKDLRPIIDEHRLSARFVLLGSASPKLVKGV